jgi:hypothetical protein
MKYPQRESLFFTVHPTALGAEEHANCENCGNSEPLGVLLGDPLGEDRADAWFDSHTCTEDQTGWYAAAAYGIKWDGSQVN